MSTLGMTKRSRPQELVPFFFQLSSLIYNILRYPDIANTYFIALYLMPSLKFPVFCIALLLLNG